MAQCLPKRTQGNRQSGRAERPCCGSTSRGNTGTPATTDQPNSLSTLGHVTSSHPTAEPTPECLFSRVAARSPPAYDLLPLSHRVTIKPQLNGPKPQRPPQLTGPKPQRPEAFRVPCSIRLPESHIKTSSPSPDSRTAPSAPHRAAPCRVLCAPQVSPMYHRTRTAPPPIDVPPSPR